MAIIESVVQRGWVLVLLCWTKAEWGSNGGLAGKTSHDFTKENAKLGSLVPEKVKYPSLKRTCLKIYTLWVLGSRHLYPLWLRLYPIKIHSMDLYDILCEL